MIGITAAILAAGRSSRMGRAKALLPVDPRATEGATFLDAIATALRLGGAISLVVVGRPADEPLRRAVARLEPPVRFVANHHADTGQLSSVVAAIDSASPRDAGVLITLVDLPFVQASTVAALLAAFAAHPDAIVRPVYRGRNGHPVIFPARLFPELRAADSALGARHVVHAHAATVHDCAVADPGVVRDVDTPDDYARYSARRE